MDSELRPGYRESVEITSGTLSEITLGVPSRPRSRSGVRVRPRSRTRGSRILVLLWSRNFPGDASTETRQITLGRQIRSEMVSQIVPESRDHAGESNPEGNGVRERPGGRDLVSEAEIRSERGGHSSLRKIDTSSYQNRDLEVSGSDWSFGTLPSVDLSGQSTLVCHKQDHRHRTNNKKRAGRRPAPTYRKRCIRPTG